MSITIYMMSKKLVLFSTLVLSPLFLLAHGTHGSGFMAGFTHPILGLDHNLAILGVSILGYVMDKSKWYLFPMAFLITMVIGGYLGIGNEATVFIEKVIAASVGISGVLIILQRQKSLAVTLLLIAIFGYFHGYAHGAEMPETNSALKYIPGFSIGVVVLALVAFGIGKLFVKDVGYNRSASIIGGALVGACVMMFLE